MIKHNRAEVPVVILVLEVIFLCILVFMNAGAGLFSSNSGNKYAGLEEVVLLEKCASLAEQYTFYENNPQLTGYSSGQIKDLAIFQKNGKSIIIEQNGKAFLSCESNGLRIKYPLS